MVGMTLLDEARTAGQTLRADGGKLVIRGPASAEPLVRRLLANKAAVLSALAPMPDAAPAAGRCKLAPAEPVCRCGSVRWRDVPIHAGQSVRRDCGRCGRFLAFIVWYGRPLEPAGGCGLKPAGCRRFSH
jgi:hypothetical protein